MVFCDVSPPHELWQGCQTFLYSSPWWKSAQPTQVLVRMRRGPLKSAKYSNLFVAIGRYNIIGSRLTRDYYLWQATRQTFPF